MYHGEKFNAWTHLVGALLALGGALWLLALAVASGDGWKVFGIAVYGATLVLLYSISTIYHSVRGRAKAILRKLDHLSIYLLIAGSYTPFCLITLRGPWGWSLFGIVWTLALIGMLQEIKPRSEARVMSLVIYAVMGQPLARQPRHRRLRLAGCGRRVLHGGDHLFRLRRALPPLARNLAPVRDRREPDAFHRHPVLCAVNRLREPPFLNHGLPLGMRCRGRISNR